MGRFVSRAPARNITIIDDFCGSKVLGGAKVLIQVVRVTFSNFKPTILRLILLLAAILRFCQNQVFSLVIKDLLADSVILPSILEAHCERIQ